MPLYEYRCRGCGSTRELLRPAAEADAAVACVCGAGDAVRLPSLIARGPAGGELPLLGASSGASPGGAAGGCCGGGGCCG